MANLIATSAVGEAVMCYHMVKVASRTQKWPAYGKSAHTIQGQLRRCMIQGWPAVKMSFLPAERLWQQQVLLAAPSC